VIAHRPEVEVTFRFRGRIYAALVWELDDGVRDVTVFEIKDDGFLFVAIGVVGRKLALLGRKLTLLGIESEFCKACEAALFEKLR
jgi:hypothetical protein